MGEYGEWIRPVTLMLLGGYVLSETLRWLPSSVSVGACKFRELHESFMKN